MSKSNIRENVEVILAKYPSARDNDKMLMMMYWEDVDGIKDIGNRFDFIFKATSPETIVRARRLIQEEGKHLPSSEAVAVRRGRQRAMTQAVRIRRVV